MEMKTKTMIVNHSEGLTTLQLAAMATSKATSLNDVAGMEITVSSWAEYVREDGENKTIFLVIKDVEGNYYSTISKSFIQSFSAFVDLMCDTSDFKVVVGKAKAKSGREFLTFSISE